MIQFRCWYCRKLYSVANYRVGERLTCTCTRPVRIPKNSGGSSRVRTIGDWLIEVILCGGGGAVLGACLGVFIISRVGGFGFRFELLIGLTLAGFVIGTLGGVRGIEWIGRKIRDREQS
jgi:hypothetical protein